MAIRSLLILLALSFSLGGCRSSDKEPGKESSVTIAPSPNDDAKKKTPSTDQKKDANDDFCAKRPEPEMCCQALTPSCNECRAHNEAVQAEWEEKCLKANTAEIDCSKSAPIVDCCEDDLETCRTCRKRALAKVLAWKEKCGTFEAHPCDRQPPQSACCQALIPSCEACKERNRRILEEWRSRCGG